MSNRAADDIIKMDFKRTDYEGDEQIYETQKKVQKQTTVNMAMNFLVPYNYLTS